LRNLSPDVFFFLQDPVLCTFPSPPFGPQTNPQPPKTSTPKLFRVFKNRFLVQPPFPQFFQPGTWNWLSPQTGVFLSPPHPLFFFFFIFPRLGSFGRIPKFKSPTSLSVKNPPFGFPPCKKPGTPKGPGFFSLELGTFFFLNFGPRFFQFYPHSGGSRTGPPFNGDVAGGPPPWNNLLRLGTGGSLLFPVWALF